MWHERAARACRRVVRARRIAMPNWKHPPLGRTSSGRRTWTSSRPPTSTTSARFGKAAASMHAPQAGLPLERVGNCASAAPRLAAGVHPHQPLLRTYPYFCGASLASCPVAGMHRHPPVLRTCPHACAASSRCCGSAASPSLCAACAAAWAGRPRPWAACARSHRGGLWWHAPAPACPDSSLTLSWGLSDCLPGCQNQAARFAGWLTLLPTQPSFPRLVLPARSAKLQVIDCSDFSNDHYLMVSRSRLFRRMFSNLSDVSVECTHCPPHSSA